MFNIAKWFIGITFALLQLDKNVTLIAGTAHTGCIIVGELYADCVDKLESSSLPSDLKKDIEVLNISQNLLDTLTDNEFVEFTKLKELIMASMSVGSVSVKLFEPLTKLQVLNLSGSALGESLVKFPLSVKRLIVENTIQIWPHVYNVLRLINVEDADFSELHQLEELYLRGNGLRKLPNVATIAPLIHLELGDNPLTIFTYNDIAPFCRLKQVGLGNLTALSSTEFVIQCCGLQTWMKKYNITTDLECAVNCPVQELSNDAVIAYEICIENMEIDQDLYGTIINIILSSALIGAIGYLALKYYRSHAVRYEHDVVKIENLESVEEEAQPEQQNYEE